VKRLATQLGGVQENASREFPDSRCYFLARQSRSEVLEGPESESIIVIEFPSCEAAQTWYHTTEYQAECEHRFPGGDYRFILTEGIAAKELDGAPKTRRGTEGNTEYQILGLADILM
jgi:uncharacterized protein (DUF1330 family)